MKTLKKFGFIAIALAAGLLLSSCVSMKLKMPDYTDPLKEFTVQGDGRSKIAVIPVNGFISDGEEKGMMHRKPSMVKEIVSQIRKAEADPEVKAVVLKVNSPGGTVTGSDILYNELVNMKGRKRVPLVVSMMDVATSGGYYVSLPADHIVAHQTTITGSVGVIFMRPKFMGLMEKVGVEIETSKSGRDKDMGSPFRPATESEMKSFQHIIDEMAGLFRTRIVSHRHPSEASLSRIMTAGIFSAGQALQLGMIDQIGFMDDAIAKARALAGVEDNARVVMYRRLEFADDNIYNNITAHSGSGTPLLDLGPLTHISGLNAGFYYTWPAVGR